MLAPHPAGRHHAYTLRCLAETKSHSAPHCHDNAIQYLHPRCIVPCRRRSSRFLTAPPPHKTLPKQNKTTPSRHVTLRNFASRSLNCTTLRIAHTTRNATLPPRHRTLLYLRCALRDLAAAPCRGTRLRRAKNYTMPNAGHLWRGVNSGLLTTRTSAVNCPYMPEPRHWPNP